MPIIKGYWRLVECVWSQHRYLHALNFTLKVNYMADEREKEKEWDEVEVVNKLKDKENRPSIHPWSKISMSFRRKSNCCQFFFFFLPSTTYCISFLLNSEFYFYSMWWLKGAFFATIQYVRIVLLGFGFARNLPLLHFMFKSASQGLRIFPQFDAPPTTSLWRQQQGWLGHFRFVSAFMNYFIARSFDFWEGGGNWPCRYAGSNGPAFGNGNAGGRFSWIEAFARRTDLDRLS